LELSALARAAPKAPRRRRSPRAQLLDAATACTRKGRFQKLAFQYLKLLRDSQRERARKGDLGRFLQRHGVSSDHATRCAFSRAVREARAQPLVEGAVAARGRKRKLGAQGRHLVKAPVLRERLFAWWCQVRGLVKGRFPLSVFEAKALALRRECCEAALSAGTAVKLPKITPNWLWRFRREYGISLRAPNKRWKVPRTVLLSRRRVLWSNTLRLRVAASVLLGYDLVADGFDQKSFHMNEAGSKGAKTLATRGVREVSLKELHDATRERWTTNAWTTSCRATALAGPPVELLFKGGEQALANLQRDLRAEGLGGLPVQTSDSGSYRNTHILTHLETALPRLREASVSQQWRLLFADAYRAHEHEAVRRLAWERGWVMVFHGGGATGVAQVNDTRLHGRLSQAYQQLEMEDAFLGFALDPGACPARSRLACCRDLVRCWRRPSLRLAAHAGWKQNMLTNALDGSENHLATSEIAAFCAELGMSKIRAQIVEGKSAEAEVGRLERSLEAVQGLLEEFAATGFLDHCEEGQEDEGDDVGEEGPPGHK